MNDYLFALIIAAYIIGGVFIVLWMNRNYFDVKYGSESSEKWSVWRVLFWPFILPFVWPKAMRIKKQRTAQVHADFEAMMAHWDAVAEEAKEMVIEGNVLVHGTAGEAIPDMVTEIGEQAFCCCEELMEVVIPDSVKKIGKEAFCACANLTKVGIPNSVIEIGSGAFDECTSLTEVHLPASLRKLGLAFDDGPYEGRDIYVHFTDPAQCQVEMLDDESTGWPANWNDRLFVPKGSCQAFEKAEPWCGFETIQEFE